MAAAGDDDGRGRDRGLRRARCGRARRWPRRGFGRRASPPLAAVPQIDPGKLGGLVQHKGLGQRVHPDGGDGVHLPQGVDRKLPLPDEDRRGPRAALAREGHGLGPGGDVGRDAGTSRPACRCRPRCRKRPARCRRTWPRQAVRPRRTLQCGRLRRFPAGIPAGRSWSPPFRSPSRLWRSTTMWK